MRLESVAGEELWLAGANQSSLFLKGKTLFMPVKLWYPY
jgi:hypothetical protein